MIYRKRSLAIVPFDRKKFWIKNHMEQMRQAILDCRIALELLTISMSRCAGIHEGFNASLSVGFKGGHGLRYRWFRLLQRLGIY